MRGERPIDDDRLDADSMVSQGSSPCKRVRLDSSAMHEFGGGSILKKLKRTIPDLDISPHPELSRSMNYVAVKGAFNEHTVYGTHTIMESHC